MNTVSQVTAFVYAKVFAAIPSSVSMKCYVGATLVVSINSADNSSVGRGAQAPLTRHPSPHSTIFSTIAGGDLRDSLGLHLGRYDGLSLRLAQVGHLRCTPEATDLFDALANANKGLTSLCARALEASLLPAT